MGTQIIPLGFFPNKFSVKDLLFRTDTLIMYRNAGTYAAPSFEDLADVVNPPAIFGDGADGDLIESSGTTTLTEIKYYQDVTLTGTAILTADQPLIIFVNGTVTVGSGAVIQMDGKGAAGGEGGNLLPAAGGAKAPAPGPGGGQPPTHGIDGAVDAEIGVGGSLAIAGTAGAPFGGDGGSGGVGSQGPGGPNTGGPGGEGDQGEHGPAGVAGTFNRILHNVHQWVGQDALPTGVGTGGSGGAAASRGGGGGGGGFNSPGPGIGGAGGLGGAAGGDGGNGGGTLIIIARNIDIQSGGIVSSDGIDAVAGANNPGGPAPLGLKGSGGGTSGGGGGGTTANGAGGGSGGNGGFIWLLYRTLIEAGTIRVLAGAAGLGGETSGPGVLHGEGGAPGGAPAGAGVDAPNVPGPTGVDGEPGTIGSVGVIQKVAI